MNSDESDKIAEREILQSLLGMHAQYHNHKEQMAFSIFGLEGAFFIGIFLFSQWPEYITKVSTENLVALFVVVWMLFHLALRFQLRNRRLAAIFVAAYYDALTQQEVKTFKRKDFILYDGLPVSEFFDTFLVPVRGVFRPSDVDLNKLTDGEEIKPMSINAFYFHVLRHKKLSSESFVGYAYPIEFMTSLGSIILLGIAIVRAVTASPATKVVLAA